MRLAGFGCRMRELAEVLMVSEWSMASFWCPGSVKARPPCMTGHDGNAGEDVGGIADRRVALEIKGKAPNRRNLVVSLPNQPTSGLTSQRV